MRDRQPERPPEDGGHREPVGQTAHHAGLGHRQQEAAPPRGLEREGRRGQRGRAEEGTEGEPPLARHGRQRAASRKSSIRSVADGPGGQTWVARPSPPLHAWPMSGTQPRLQHGRAARIAVDGVDGALGGRGGAAAGAEDAHEHRFQRGEVGRADDGVEAALPQRDAQARAPPARGRGGGAVASGAAQALDRPLGPAGAPIGTAGGGADTDHRVGHRAGQIHRHPGAGREAQHDHPSLAHAAVGLHAPGDGHDLGRLAPGRGLLGRLEPVPAAVRVLAPALGGIDDHEAAPLGGLVEPRPEGEVLRRLPAAVQRDHEGSLGCWSARHPHTVGPALQCAPTECAAGRSGAEEDQRRQEHGRDRAPAGPGHRDVRAGGRGAAAAPVPA